jgi:UDP-GlcNAc:undecaprenyl-phosphate GlcNAc-1-phosphate transferase
MKLLLYFFNFFFTFYLFRRSNYIAKKLKLFDYPDSTRKKHYFPTPVVGGLIFFISTILIFIISNQEIYNFFFYEIKDKIRPLFFCFSFFILFLLGIVDDKINLKPMTKFIIFFIIFYCLFLLIPNYEIKILKFSFYKSVDLFQLAVFFSVFCLIFFINSMNMFDGINLQLSILFLIVWTYIGLNFGFSDLVFNVIIFLLIFSYFNFKKKVFLGDCGVYLLSFLTFFYFIRLYNSPVKNIYLDEIICIFFLPFIDILRVIILRIKLNKNPMDADENHFHHILLKNFNYNITISIIFLGYLFPIALYKILNINFYMIFLLFISYYLFLVNFSYKKKYYVF